MTQGSEAFRALYKRLRNGGHDAARTFPEDNSAGQQDWGRVRQMARFFTGCALAAPSLAAARSP